MIKFEWIECCECGWIYNESHMHMTDEGLHRCRHCTMQAELERSEKNEKF